MSNPIRYAIIFVILFCPSPQALAESTDDALYKMFTLYFENDTFFGTDYHYTNGIKLVWTSGDLDNYGKESTLASFARSLGLLLPVIKDTDLGHYFSLAVGQNMYTPEDTKNPDLIKNDRPYAGLTYFEMGLNGQDRRKVSSWEIVLGMVGPHSYASDTQKAVHEWNGWEAPAGWKHQIKDEPILNLFFNQKYKLLFDTIPGGWGADIIPAWGAGAGNLYAGGHVGVQIRVGYNLPDDFGTNLIRPGCNSNTLPNEGDATVKNRYRFGLHLFVGADGYYCLRDLTLDGNTYQHSPSVEKEPLVGSFMAGLGVTFMRCKISFAHVSRSREFKAQKDPEQFGSITLNYLF